MPFETTPHYECRPSFNLRSSRVSPPSAERWVCTTVPGFWLAYVLFCFCGFMSSMTPRPWRSYISWSILTGLLAKFTQSPRLFPWPEPRQCVGPQPGLLQGDRVSISTRHSLQKPTPHTPPGPVPQVLQLPSGWNIGTEKQTQALLPRSLAHGFISVLTPRL